MNNLIVKTLMEKYPEIELYRQIANEYYLAIPRESLVTVSQSLAEQGAVLSIMTGTDERSLDGYFRLYYGFSFDELDIFMFLVVALKEPDLVYPSLTPSIPAAHWYEREAMDMLGLRPEGHPQPNRLVLHHDWPLGVRPLRKDFPKEKLEEVTEEKAEHRYHQVEGEGGFYVPVGPIHAGIIEPGHFRFATAGEKIVSLEARLFYTHRGIEKEAEGLNFTQGLDLAERICGVCAYSHSTAYCQVLEKLAGVEIPLRAQFIRTLLMEMERLYNHIGDLGNICAGVGFAFGSSNGGRIKERLQRLNKYLVGHRFLRGINQPGGLKFDLPQDFKTKLAQDLAEIEKDVNELVEILLENVIFLNRINTTGIITLKNVQDLAVVGPAARGAGWNRDCRKIHPYGVYEKLEFEVPTCTTGDVAARFKIRYWEALQSFKIIRQILDRIPEGPISVKLGHIPPYQFALGYAESPRGEDLHWLMTGENNTIFRYRVRSASYPNWPVVPLAVRGNIVPDFPLINKSFELCYACLDR